MSFTQIKIGRIMKTALFTWAELMGGTAVVTGVYYAVVAGVFYKEELKRLLNRPERTVENSPRLRKRTTNAMATDEQLIPAKLSDGSTASGLSPVAHDLIAELNAFIDQSVAESKPREEVITSLIALLRKYPGLKQSLFEQAITNLITSELDMRANILLSQEEQAMLWQ